MTIIHMQTDEVRSLASRMNLAVDNIGQEIQSLYGILLNLDWQGYSRDEFAIELEHLRENILNLTDAGMSLAGRLHREIDEWEAAAASLGTAGVLGAGSSTDPVEAAPSRQVFVQGDGEAHVIDPSDIDQGQLGDCYLMASLAAIAVQNPDLLQNLICDNGDGTYTVTFYAKKKFLGIFDSGYEQVEIRVSADVPERNGTPIYAGLGDTVDGQQEIWGMVVEKAYAEWKGGYDEIEGGWPHNALEALTGIDSQDFKPRSMEIQAMAEHLRDGDAITLASLTDLTIGDIDILDKTSFNDLYQNDTLVGNHAYYVSAVDVDNGTVTIRNPWGWEHPEIELPYDEFQSAFQKVTINELN